MISQTLLGRIIKFHFLGCQLILNCALSSYQCSSFCARVFWTWKVRWGFAKRSFKRAETLLSKCGRRHHRRWWERSTCTPFFLLISVILCLLKNKRNQLNGSLCGGMFSLFQFCLFTHLQSAVTFDYYLRHESEQSGDLTQVICAVDDYVHTNICLGLYLPSILIAALEFRVHICKPSSFGQWETTQGQGKAFY